MGDKKMNKEKARSAVIGAISMALKDPILQQGFEIICKELAELEKENAELKADNDARKFAMAMSEKVEKQLRKENAKLKGIKDVATLIRANNDTVITLMQLNNKLVSKSQQLTKAKELLKRCYDNYIYLQPLRGDIEQFLKEEE
jgi:hypothetical protein